MSIEYQKGNKIAKCLCFNIDLKPNNKQKYGKLEKQVKKKKTWLPEIVDVKDAVIYISECPFNIYPSLTDTAKLSYC